MADLTPHGYADLLATIKQQIRQRQYQALRAVNRELVALYWDLGEAISRKQEEHGWGKAVVENLARDLQSEFPGRNGFSARNLWNMLEFYRVYAAKPKLQALVAEISWAKNLTIFSRCKDDLEREFYLRATARFGWTKDVLQHQIDNKSYDKYLLGQTNFGNSSYSLAIGATGRLRVVTHDGTTNIVSGGETPLVNGVWQHIAATFDLGTERMCVNGVLDATATGVAAPMNATLELAFGREGAVARSAADIAAFRSSRLVGNETGLAGYWRFDDGTGDVASDATGRGNHGRLGTAVGADTWGPRWTTNAAPVR